MSAHQKAQQAQQKTIQLQKQVDGLVEDLHQKKIAPIQKDVFLCGARCCDNTTGVKQLSECVEQCSSILNAAQDILHRGLGEHQERFQRCAVRCQESAQDGLPPSPTDKDIHAAEEQMGGCIEKCIADFEDRLPRLKKDLESKLSQI